ncbi:iron-siderophore ABC transporter substrate-binding protein [Breznakia pachnodae]|uniref:Iron complex transport system substrate-binding protein n=1 Tax=Breznakia pachnodae TaxID=265178 RepID=A0ABU0E0Y6_9FIRM|nr:iron-siderophore ABC transporter substrate-binding protein [Breznakia pachnodae]MDQ0360366.1 iron complex transport system substrate-binding protein [Breznakia pachnodae]
MKKLLSVFFALAIIVSGCSNGSSSDDDKDTSNSDGEFPITIEHAFGETTIEEKPENIVAIAWGNQDDVLALGVTPVGVSKANYGIGEDEKLLPWTQEAFEELGVEDPVVFDDVDGLDYEAISDANPDIILATYSGITQEEYDLLSEIAPVIPYEEAAYQTTWREQLLTNSKAIGMEEEGKELVKELEETIATEVAKYPEIEGKTAAFMYFDVADLGQVYVYGENDPRAAYLQDLGFTQADSISEILDGTTEFGTYFSAEKAEDLSDVDVIILYGDDTTLEALQNDPLIGTIPAIQNGAVVILENNSTLAASTTPSSLSIPYSIEEYAKLMGEAAAKVK